MRVGQSPLLPAFSFRSLPSPVPSPFLLLLPCYYFPPFLPLLLYFPFPINLARGFGKHCKLSSGFGQTILVHSDAETEQFSTGIVWQFYVLLHNSIARLWGAKIMASPPQAFGCGGDGVSACVEQASLTL